MNYTFKPVKGRFGCRLDVYVDFVHELATSKHQEVMLHSLIFF